MSAESTTASCPVYHQADIIVVGAGAIGLSIAKALIGAGLKIAIIDCQTQDSLANPASDGREIAITHRTRAIMQDLHQWQRLDRDTIHFLRKAEVYNGTSSFALGFDKPRSVKGKPVDTLGYLVSNWRIRKAAFDALSPYFGQDVQAFFARTVQQIQTTTTYATVNLDNGAIIRGKLIVAADSRLSFVRKALGIATDMHDFGRTVLVFRTRHTQSNGEIAHEGFYYGKTLAVLPLGEFCSSMVITASTSDAKAIAALNKDALAQEITAWLGGRLGTMSVEGDVHSYPLVGTHARTFYANRVVLLGDAAVGMHPVTAHGYNLGMEGVALLSKQLLLAYSRGDDLGAEKYLRHYSHRHSLKTRPMYHGTNAIVGLYTDESISAKALRHMGLRVAQGFLPIKRLITKQLTG